MSDTTPTTTCTACGHQHTGYNFAHICIGCPRQETPGKADALVDEDVAANADSSPRLLNPEQLADIKARAAWPTPDLDADDGPTCASCNALVTVDNDCVWINGEDLCHGCEHEELDRARYDIPKLLAHIDALDAAATVKLQEELTANWEKEAEKALTLRTALFGTLSALINGADVLDVVSQSDRLLPEGKAEVLRWAQECRAAHANATAVLKEDEKSLAVGKERAALFAASASSTRAEVDALRAELEAAEKHVEIATTVTNDWHSRYVQAVEQYDVMKDSRDEHKNEECAAKARVAELEPLAALGQITVTYAKDCVGDDCMMCNPHRDGSHHEECSVGLFLARGEAAKETE